MTTTTTTRPEGPPLDRWAEQRLLQRGDPDATPRVRAELHGLDLRAYLAAVYGYDVGQPAATPARARPMRYLQRAAGPRRAA